MSFQLDYQAPAERKKEVETLKEQLYQVLMDKSPADIDQYLLNNLSQVIEMSDAQIDAFASGLDSIPKVQNAIGTLAKDLKFLAGVNRTQMKMLMLIARKVL